MPPPDTSQAIFLEHILNTGVFKGAVSEWRVCCLESYPGGSYEQREWVPISHPGTLRPNLMTGTVIQLILGMSAIP